MINIIVFKAKIKSPLEQEEQWSVACLKAFEPFQHNDQIFVAKAQLKMIHFNQIAIVRDLSGLSF